jgi:hypothetical protein
MNSCVVKALGVGSRWCVPYECKNNSDCSGGADVASAGLACAEGKGVDRSRRPHVSSLKSLAYIFFSEHVLVAASHMPPAALQSISPKRGFQCPSLRTATCNG